MPTEKAMEHTESVESMAVERYLLKEMPPDEREAFEEHFFDCVECATDLRAGDAIVAGVRARKAKPQARPRLAWLSIAAAAAFAMISGFLGGVVVPQLTGQLASLQRERDAAIQPRLLTTHRLSIDMSRGGSEDSQEKFRGDQPFALDVDIPLVNGATGFVLEIVDARGVTLAKVPVTVDEARDTVHLQPPGGKLAPGRYSLIVSPLAAGNPSSVSFVVQ
jgi:anti-sigma factor RsiW